MIKNNDKKLVKQTMDFALKNGCQAVKIRLSCGTNSVFEVRDMKVDYLQQASENSLEINLFVDDRYGSFSTNRLDKKEIEKLILNGIDSVKYLEEDKARTLPDSSLYYKGNDDLQLFDFKYDTIKPDDKIDLAKSVCNEMMNKDSRIISANSIYRDNKSFRYMITSNGFEGETSATSFRLYASISIKGDGDARPESEWYDSSIYIDSLIKEGIGTKALERVIKKLGQTKVSSGKYTMVVENVKVNNLLNPMINALYGNSIQQKNSFLVDKLNQKVLGENITIMDEPHLPKTFGARFFDSEGIATKHQPIFEKGVLKTYFIDTYSGNKLNMAPTVGSPSILTLELGNKNLEGLISSVKKGILVTGFNGGNSNSTTGDFSYGIEGFMIENGILTDPVNEMNITGNFLTLWNNLKEAGNDPFKASSWKIPSLVFEGVDFSGL